MLLSRSLAPILALVLLARGSDAQTGYRNLDGMRPTRIEDAAPTELNELEIELPTLRLERVNGGFYRWRAEPKLSYGVLPHAELEVRVPFVYREGAATPRGGMAGVGFSGAYALNTETLGWPAMMIGAEAVVPAGPAAAPVAAGSVRAMLTRTIGGSRLHLNGSFGNYGIVRPLPFTPDTSGGGSTPIVCPPGTISTSQGTCISIPPDFPCVMSARPTGQEVTVFACRPLSMPSVTAQQQQQQQQVAPSEVFESTRWAAGLGIDRTFPIRSLLIVADVFAEQLRGLPRPIDWSGEIGFRQQLGVRSVVDAGWGRRFTGPDQAWYVNAGVSYGIGIRQARR